MNPDPEEFAKTVLWHVCNLRTEIATLKLQIQDLQMGLGHFPDSKTVQELERREQDLFEATYQQACEAVKLDPTPPGRRPFGSQ